ncbi:type III-B CRISPR module RAMP protein Cmr1 [Candidatus Viridilinea mediisalina]|nr:type III-B CRISPR module RAMP protein Cmr1 [Candidatus Viridilinea mediisalina]
MMRGANLKEPPELTLREDMNRSVQTRAYRLLTPLFGGSVQPGQPDQHAAVRGSSVRGQLRFWWRATRGGYYQGDLARMKAAESLLWGAASSLRHKTGRSLVDVVVINQPGAHPFTPVNRSNQPIRPPLTIGHPSSIDSYAAFPLNDKPDTFVLDHVAFHLQLTLPVRWEDEASSALFAGTPSDELAAALWAWETFGGIGARTRRGFGALHCLQVDGVACPLPNDVRTLKAWLNRQLAQHVVAGVWPEHVPHLAQHLRFHVGTRHNEALSAWRELIGKLKDFRQQRPVNRVERRGRIVPQPGRNHWPEQDEVREITGRRSRRHQDVISTVRKFPRAAFGLPLLIQYKKEDQKDGDPRGDNKVVGRLRDGTNVERLASPLILRPLLVNNGAVGLAAILEGVDMPDQLLLNYERGSQVVEWQLTAEEAAMLTNHRGQPILGNETDVVQAFLNRLEG